MLPHILYEDYLFKDKTLNIAILFSTLWHIFFFCTITPIFITPGFKSYGRILVSYLGAVLSEIAPENQGFEEVEGRRSKVEEIFDTVTKSGGFVEIPLLKPQLDSKPIDFEEISERAFFNADIRGLHADSRGFIVRSIHEYPRSISENPRSEVVFEMSPQLVIIEGEAKKRELLWTPMLPKYARLLFLEEMQYEVRLRFFISSYGEVMNVEKAVSSGSAMIDEIAYNYVKGLKFLPLPKEDISANALDEGVIVIRF